MLLAKMDTSTGSTMEKGSRPTIITSVLTTALEKPGVRSNLAKLSSPQNCGVVVGSMFQLKKLR